MTTITIPRELERRLKDLKGRAELRDEQGQLIGFFNPKPTTDELMASCPHSEEELRRRESQCITNGKSTAEVIEEMRRKWPTE